MGKCVCSKTHGAMSFFKLKKLAVRAWLDLLAVPQSFAARNVRVNVRVNVRLKSCGVAEIGC